MTTLPDQRYGIPSGSHSIIGGNLVSINAPPGPAGRLHLDRYSFDAEYLRRLREGDPETTNHFVGYFTEKLTFLLWQRNAPKSSVDDIIQETFARVFVKLQSANGILSPASFAAFVFGVCKNHAFERYRDMARQDQLDDDSLNLPSPDLDSEQRMLAGEKGEAVRRTLRLMKPREREILVAILIDRRPKAEVCTKFNITRANLRVVLHRAIARFRFLFPKDKR